MLLRRVQRTRSVQLLLLVQQSLELLVRGNKRLTLLVCFQKELLFHLETLVLVFDHFLKLLELQLLVLQILLHRSERDPALYRNLFVLFCLARKLLVYQLQLRDVVALFWVVIRVMLLSLLVEHYQLLLQLSQVVDVVFYFPALVGLANVRLLRI